MTPTFGSRTRHCATAVTRCRIASPSARFATPSRALDGRRVPVIEVAHGDGLGGSTFNYGFSAVEELTLIAAAADEARSARIAVLLVPGSAPSRTCGAPLMREPGSLASRRTAPRRTWPSSISAPRANLGMETVGFLMLSHMSPSEDLAQQARIMVDAGCQCVYVVDSAGALILDEATDRVGALVERSGPTPRWASTGTITSRWVSPTRSWRNARARDKSTARLVHLALGPGIHRPRY